MKPWLKLAEAFGVRTKAEATLSKLQPLYPENIEKEHVLYVSELNSAAEDAKVKNVALTGGYGSGKSSILSGFEEGRSLSTIRISFSTLGTNIQKYILEATNGELAPWESDHDKLNTLTNLIQKEIVKQILFKEDYKSTPYSKYQRVSSPSKTFVLFTSGVIGLITSIVIILTGSLAHFFNIFIIPGIWSQIVLGSLMCIILSAASGVFIFTMWGKFKIDKISGSSVALSLSGENNYFDEYLDEIVYFFTATKYDVIIFEDIDRFDNLYIFENLRQLNTILNGVSEISKKKKITFVYAVKDSIFSKKVSDKEKNEENPGYDSSEKAFEEDITNRTKFFDVIIPVVPFITHSSSRELILEQFKEFRLSDELAAIVSRYITDMRLIKNIYNEFVIFQNKVMDSNKANNLSTDKLFAMMVYKNCYLQDFEDAKNGTSLLGKVYNASRKFVNDVRIENNAKVQDRKAQINSGASIASYAHAYGLKLVDYVDKIASRSNATISTYTFKSVTYSREELLTEKFWSAVSEGVEANETLSVRYTFNRLNYSYNINLATSDIVEIVGGEVRADTLSEEESVRISKEIASLERETKDINYRNIKELMGTYPEFRDKIGSLVGLKTLLYGLVESGYIDEEYTYYMSVYHAERISMKARNFILQNIRFNMPDVSYQFKDNNDIENMLSEVGVSYLNDRSMYNVSIVDYLLPRKLDKRVNYIFRSLAKGGADERDFIDTYIREGKSPESFIKKLSSHWKGVFVYVIGLETRDDAKAKIIRAAIQGSDSQLDYDSNDQVKMYLNRNLHSIEKRTDKGMLKKLSDPGRLFNQLGVQVEDMRMLDENTRAILVKSSSYQVNKNNLGLLFRGESLSLTNIRVKNKDVYLHVMNNLAAYLDATRTTQVIEGNNGFALILNDIVTHSPENLGEVLERTNAECVIDELLQVSEQAWVILFKKKMVANRLQNILTYYEQLESESIDESLATYLNSGIGIGLAQDHDIEEKRVFALTILRSSVIDDEVKADLIQDLALGVLLDVEDFFGEEGSFYGALLRLRIIEDTADNYRPLLDLGWKTKEAYIANSERFLEYIADVELSSEDINQAMRSRVIATTIKDYFLDNIADYASKISKETGVLMADYAITVRKALSPVNLNVLLKLLDSDKGIELMNLSFVKLSRDDMVSALTLVGGGYADLARPGYRPVIDNSIRNINLINNLTTLGMVKTQKVEKGGIRVNMRRKWN